LEVTAGAIQADSALIELAASHDNARCGGQARAVDTQRRARTTVNKAANVIVKDRKVASVKRQGGEQEHQRREFGRPSERRPRGKRQCPCICAAGALPVSPGDAIAAGTAIGAVATAAAWAHAAPAPGYCRYHADPSRTKGFWGACP